MRMVLILSLVCMMQTFALDSYTQNARISLSAKEMKLESILLQIENQSKYRFAYNKNEIDVTKKYSIKIKEAEIKSLLSQLFSEEDISYTFIDRQIVLSSSKKISVVQQQKSVSGKVTDIGGQPIPGVTVRVKGTALGTITNTDGNYLITGITNDAVLIFSFVGMRTQKITAGSQTSINVAMEEDVIGLEEVVAIGYGTQRKGNLTGAISNVKSEKLTVAPINNISNALIGQAPGLISKQSSGLPGSDMATLNIRGFGNALVIVDGIESNLNNIDVNQIESVSILKDGAASIYGSRAGNGVILVTTKRGQNQKPTISVNSSYTLQGVVKMLDPSSSGQRAEMEREAYLQSGQPEAGAPWTEEAVAKFYAGDDPAYLNVNWFDHVFRTWAPQQNHNISIRGGSDRIKYYGFLGYLDQETMIKRNGGDYSRYNAQSNIDASVTDDINITVDISLALENRNFPIRGLQNGGYVWQDAYLTRPWYPTVLPDASKISWGGLDVGSVATVTNIDLMGYNRNRALDLRGAISLEYNLSRIINGLKAKASINYHDNEGYSKNFAKPITFYTYNPNNQEYTQAGSFLNSYLTEYMNRSNAFTQQYSLNYNNTFNKIHRVSALALLESIDYNSNYFNASRRNLLTSAIDQLFIGSTTGMGNDGSASEMGRMSYVFRLNYSFMDRYLVETILRADASAKFPKNSRWGYFPSISLGWIVTQEEFMKSVKSIDNLKFRASYGQSGNDGVGNFQYLSGYSVRGTAILDDAPQTGLYSTGLANPFLTWEKISIYNAGLDFSIFKILHGTGEVFYRKRKGIPTTRLTSLPSTFGASLPPENLNSIDDRGFEFNLGISNAINDFSYDISGNISWSRSKWIHYEEPEYTDPDQKRIYQISGQWTDRVMGYVSEGLFTSQEQINSLNYVYTDLGDNSSLRPGDVIYKDLNGDHKLNWKDQKDIGKGTIPHWTYGINLSLKYKNFDLTGLFQGAFGYNTTVYYDPLLNPAKRYELRWTEQNNDPNSLVPRLGGAISNDYTSDYRYRKTTYIRLKTASLGYELPDQMLNKIGINKLRVYFAGTNLLTFSSLSKYGVDPEVPSGIAMTYPIQRTLSLGINISF